MDQKFNPLGRRRPGSAEISPTPDTIDSVSKEERVDSVVARSDDCANEEIEGVAESEGELQKPNERRVSRAYDQLPVKRSDVSSSNVSLLKRADRISQREAALKVGGADGIPLPPGEQPFNEEVALMPPGDSQVAGTVLGGFSTSWFRTLGWLGWCILVLIGASFLLVTLSQTAVLVREINSWILPAQVAGWVALSAIWLAVAVASFYLARIFVRYRQSPGVSLAALEQIRERGENRALAAQSAKAAAEKVRQFLNEYPTDETQCVFLKSVLDPATQENLFSERKQLLNEDHGVSSQWLTNVRKRYTYKLDESARKIVFRHSVAIGLGTAVSPRGAIDSVIVLVGMQRMTIDLCRLYGVRPGRLESLIILGHVLVAAMFAAGGDEASDAIADQIQETLASSIGALGAGIAGKLGGKATEGTVNAMFARRIGVRLQRYLSPIRD